MRWITKAAIVTMALGVSAGGSYVFFKNEDKRIGRDQYSNQVRINHGYIAASQKAEEGSLTDAWMLASEIMVNEPCTSTTKKVPLLVEGQWVDGLTSNGEKFFRECLASNVRVLPISVEEAVNAYITSQQNAEVPLALFLGALAGAFVFMCCPKRKEDKAVSRHIRGSKLTI